MNSSKLKKISPYSATIAQMDRAGCEISRAIRLKIRMGGYPWKSRKIRPDHLRLTPEDLR